MEENVELVVRGALVETCDGNRTRIQKGGLAVNEGRIVAVGSDAELKTFSGRQTIEGHNCVLLPGLINTHCHAGTTLFRGLVEDLPLEPWLQRVWKAEQATLTQETARLGACLGLAENLLAGVTTVIDMYWFHEQTVAAAAELGMRVGTGCMYFDCAGMEGVHVKDVEAEARRFCQRYSSDPTVIPVVMPHAGYTVKPDGLMSAAEVAREFDCLLTIHAAETRKEQQVMQKRYGRSVVRHLEQLGLLSSKTILAHCVHLDQHEIEILGAHRAVVAHNPVSNLKLGSGFAPLTELASAGAQITLGTDGAISGNDLDLWWATRLAVLLQRGRSENATAMRAQEAFDMVTCNAAKALGMASELGSLEIGKWADFCLLDTSGPSSVPLFDSLNHLVFAAGKSDVRDVFVAGRCVVRSGELVNVDTDSLLGKVRELQPRIVGSMAAKRVA